MKKSAFLLAVCLGLVFFVPFSWATTSSLPDKETVSHALCSLSIPFIENKGQIDNNVAYYAKTLGSTLYVTRKGEMVYGFAGFTLIERIPGLIPSPKGLTPSHTNVSSFKGNDPSKWQKSLPTYGSVSLGEVTTGIIVSLNAYGGRIEKIITVSPRTAPSVILSVEGASSLGFSPEGELIIHTDQGDLTFSKPVAYQEINGNRIPVPVAYMLPQERDESHHSEITGEKSAADHPQSAPTYAFAVGSHDSSYPLTIDPILQSTYLGGSGDDSANAIAIGASGVYVAGHTTSTDFPGTAGGAQSTYGGGDQDVFVALLTPELKTITQATYLGGSMPDYTYALAVGASGVYVSGLTSSSDFPGTLGGAQPSNGGSTDAFVALLTPDLKTLTQATYLGGSAQDSAGSLALGASGVYVAGMTFFSDFPGTTGGAQPTFGGVTNDAFVALLTPDLKTLTQSTYLGGSGDDDACALTIGAEGVYVAGLTNFSSDFPGTAEGAQPARGGTWDAFIALLTPDLKTLTQSTYLGGSGEDFACALALGAEGVYAAGSTGSSDFPGTAEGAQPTFGGADGDAFVALLTPDLKTLTQATYLGGGCSDGASALGMGTSGVYVAGSTCSYFPSTAGGAQPVYWGVTDAFVALLTPDLKTLTQATYLGGSGSDGAGTLAIGVEGVYVAGSTGSSDFPGTAEGAQPTFGGADRDAFVALLTFDLRGDYRLSIIKSGAGSGSVTSDPFSINCGADCSDKYSAGTVVTLTASPETDSVFGGWSGGGCSGTGACEVTMNADVTVTATFDLHGPLSVNEGTIGTHITINGSSFGMKKGKVLIGDATTKILGWSDISITCEIKKPLLSGPYNLVVQAKEPKGAKPITYAEAFTMMAPEILSVSPISGLSGAEVELSGNFFGNKKGKVYVGGKKCKVSSWTMDAGTGESHITFVVPKNMASGTYDITVINKVGTTTRADGFIIP